MIGIFTPHGAVNYGTRLQAFAVQTLIEKYDDIEIIDYYPSVFEKGRRKLIRLIFGLEKYKDVKVEETGKHDSPENIKLRVDAISRFNNQYKFSPPIKTKFGLRKKTREYSAVICGSDQVWNPRLIANHVNLLEFVPNNVNKVSIAASFGVSEIPDILKKYYKKYLSRFSSLSVREESACNMVNDLGIDDVFWSLDPTLIVDKNKWIELAEKGINALPDEPYVFCYFLGTHKLGRCIARKVSKAFGNCKIVNLPHFKQYVLEDENFADINLYDVGIPEFVSLINGAKAVITDSFHGTAFSIIFQKDIYCTPRHISSDSGNTNNRLDSLLNLLQIEKRIITNESDIDTALTTHIDYIIASRILDEKRQECLRFISNALS